MVGALDMAYADRQLLLEGIVAKMFDCGSGIGSAVPQHSTGTAAQVL